MDHRAKLEWARKHLDTLETSIQSYVDSDTCKIGIQFDTEMGCYVARLRDVKTAPPEWSLMIGDIVHNTRSALDALTYSLAVKNLGRDPTKDEVKDLQFVIVDDVAAWNRQCDRRLRCLSTTAQQAVESFQPYHRTDASVRHALSVLRDLSNIDKHRHVIITVVSASSSSIFLSGEMVDDGTMIAGYVGPLIEGAVVAKWNFAMGPLEVPVQYHSEVNANAKMTIEVQFGRTMATPAGGHVGAFLDWLLDWIRDEVFPPLEALL